MKKDVNTNGESIVDPQSLVESLEVLVLESRDKSIASLGESLFFKIYRLCAECMESESAGEGGRGAGMAAKNAKLLKDLEVALCDQLQGGIEKACEAVFGVKVLLALEMKLISVRETLH